jgi:hypothetical protein
MSTETYHMNRTLLHFDFTQNWKQMTSFNKFFAIKYHGNLFNGSRVFMSTDRRSDFNKRSWGL